MKTSLPFELADRLASMEQHLGTIFKDLLESYNLRESSATILNEMELLEWTGSFLWKKLKPDFLAIGLYQEETGTCVPIYRKVRPGRTSLFKKFLPKKGGPRLRRARLTFASAAAGSRVPVLSVPLKSGGESIGLLHVSSADLDEAVTSLVVSCCTVASGCGIPQESLDRIFEVFYSTKGQRGTGLGLALVKKIVEDHRGDIAVRSTVGEGTTFLLTFPLRPS